MIEKSGTYLRRWSLDKKGFGKIIPGSRRGIYSRGVYKGLVEENLGLIRGWFVDKTGFGTIIPEFSRSVVENLGPISEISFWTEQDLERSFRVASGPVAEKSGTYPTLVYG